MVTDVKITPVKNTDFEYRVFGDGNRKNKGGQTSGTKRAKNRRASETK